MTHRILTSLLFTFLISSVCIGFSACSGDEYGDQDDNDQGDVMEASHSNSHYYMTTRPIIRNRHGAISPSQRTTPSVAPEALSLPSAEEEFRRWKEAMIPLRNWSTHSSAELRALASDVTDRSSEFLEQKFNELEEVEFPELVPFCGQLINRNAENVACLGVDYYDYTREENSTISLFPLTLLPNLKVLELNAVAVNDWDLLSSLPNLKSLTLSMCDGEEDCNGPSCTGNMPDSSQLSQVSALNSLKLMGQYYDANRPSYDLSKLAQLRFLEVSGAIAVKGVEYLSHLETLTIRQARLTITQAGTQLSKLRSADLAHDTSVDPNAAVTEGRIKLFASPALTHYRDNNLGNKGLELLVRNAPNLKSLNISFSQVDRLGSMSPLSKLESLDLSDLKLASLEALRHLTRLKTLKLGQYRAYRNRNPHTLNIRALAHLKQLKKLNLSGQKIVSLRPLRSLRLQHLDLSEAKYGGLARLRPVRHHVKAIKVSVNSNDNLGRLPRFTRLEKLELILNIERDLKDGYHTLRSQPQLKTLMLDGIIELADCEFLEESSINKSEIRTLCAPLTKLKKQGFKIEVPEREGCGC